MSTNERRLLPPRSPAARRHRVIGTLLIVSILWGSAALTNNGAQAATSQATPGAATATATSPSSVSLWWASFGDPKTSKHVITTFLTVGSTWTNVGTTTACGTCTTAVVNGLSGGSTYVMSIQAVTRRNVQSAPAWATATTPTATTPPPTTPPPTTPGALCTGASGICIGVDPTLQAGAILHTGSGLNLGFTGSTPQSVVTPIAPRYWRISPMDIWAYNYVRTAGATVNVLLSNGFAVNNWDASTSRVVRNPWQDWNGYKAFVVNAVRYSVANNIVPDTWEIQNEPDTGYYGTAVPATRALILQQFQVAHDAIRSVLPNTRIVGPSLGNFENSNPNALVDLTSFFDNAVAKNLRFDVISWHEIGKYQFGDAESDPNAIVDHAAQVRSLLSARPSLGQPALSINEYGAEWWQNDPGATARYVAVLETIGAESAAASCFPVSAQVNFLWVQWFDTCTSDPGLLDGLRAWNGGTNASYWVHVAYAAMTGSRVGTVVTEPWTNAVSSLAPDGTVTVLAGRAHGCRQGVQQYCPAGPDATAAAQVVVRQAATMAGRYTVTVQRIPNVGALGGPVMVSTSTVVATNGTFTVPIGGGMADGDAIVVRMVPA